MEHEQFTSKGLYILGGIIIGGFVLLLIILLSMSSLPRDSNGLLYTLLGGFGSSFTMVVSFFFGSSVDSFKIKNKKNDKIEE